MRSEHKTENKADLNTNGKQSPSGSLPRKNTHMLVLGDALEGLRQFPSRFVQTCITSPPYFGLRDYGVDGQIGLEETPQEYIERLVTVFREVRRVLRDDGTLWLNLGDSYAGSGGYSAGSLANRTGSKQSSNRGSVERGGKHFGLTGKNLLGIPWRVALALQADGWILRSDIIWHKPAVMPESVRDRPTKAHEYLFLLSKQERYYYDQDAIKEPSKYPNDNRKARSKASHKRVPTELMAATRPGSMTYPFRNKRDVWTIPTRPYKGAHFATFPPALVEPCILAGTSEIGRCPKCFAPWRRVVERQSYGDLRNTPRTEDLVVGKRKMKLGRKAFDQYEPPKPVGWEPTCSHHDLKPVPCIALDPFMGSATVGEVAALAGRDFVGIELNSDYWKLAHDRETTAIQKALGVKNGSPGYWVRVVENNP